MGPIPMDADGWRALVAMIEEGRGPNAALRRAGAALYRLIK